MIRFFIAANLWLVFSKIVVLGQTPDALDPNKAAKSSIKNEADIRNLHEADIIVIGGGIWQVAY